jgi:hypothetical protein
MRLQRIVLYVAGLSSLAATALGKPSSTKTTAMPPAITCTSRTKGSHQFCEITGGGSISVVQRNNAPPQIKVLSQNGFVVDTVSPELYSCIEKCFAGDKDIHILGASGSRKWQTTVTNSNQNLPPREPRGFARIRHPASVLPDPLPTLGLGAQLSLLTPPILA